MTIGLPVYRGERFLEEALLSAQRQTYPHFEVVISLDGPDPACETLCRPFLEDPRFRLVVQPEQLGWVGNINWLMARLATPWWMYHQQDDVLDPRCLEVLVECARRTPEAAVVYSDIEAFGTYSGTFVQTSVTGTASARQLVLLYEHIAGVAFRGLTRAEAVALSGGIPLNEVDSFACEVAWMAAAARSGELHRVPQTLSRKRYHADNVHTKWDTWPTEKRTRAWTVHCAAMLEQAMLVDASAPERRLLWLAAVTRLFSPRTAARHIPVASMGAAARTALLEAFVDYVRTVKCIDVPALFDASWDDVRGWTAGFAARGEP
ncbi:MAG TPA: glycosyltransferase family A protein [Candidatus Elarobacter sp.]|nr:glycosyltransferase family A protein [Candidatus Elarobacter sp.]